MVSQQLGAAPPAGRDAGEVDIPPLHAQAMANTIERLLLTAATLALDSTDEHVLSTYFAILNDLTGSARDTQEGSACASAPGPPQPQPADSGIPHKTEEATLTVVATVPQRLLSARQYEALRLRAEGRRTREIAALMCVSEETVETHIHRAGARLGAHGGWYNIVVAAQRRGLLPDVTISLQESCEQ